MEEINTIFLFGIKIDEPVVTLTDLLVSVLCFIFAYKIHRKNKTEKVFIYFKLYFLLMGIATAFGGLIGHAFLYHFNFYWKLPGWITSMFSIMFVERAAIEHTRIQLSNKIVQLLSILNIVEFLIFLTLTVVTLNFFYVEFHSGYGLMFIVLSLEGFLYLKTRNKSSKFILIGVLFAAIAALVFMNQLSIHQWFNYLSVSHILMAAAAWFFYLGAINIIMESSRLKN
ncbi:hypothetical protein SLH46_11000 [Draconibacterium sp. IB214405]|uniref:DUF6962 family protein n=1 Tax=Draconibacterium sp. IB214405 TaxID=3097352 RepID=UPI002A0E2FFC|nr:hypothetical protein [Draconibacterium sp. IB214405]MDX8339714.1 hypothetical protein [Draconibacterium sp. IB214405]